MITGNYNLTPTTEWKNVQLEDIFLDCDTTLADVNIFLPELALLNRFWGNRIHILNRIGANAVNIIAYTTLLPTPVTDFINGVSSVTLQSVGDSCVVSVEGENNWICNLSGGSAGVPVIAPTLAQAGLATPAYTELGVGTLVAVVDYDATGDGCTLVKTTLANGDHTDWIVLATDLVASSGGIGTNPI
jgi:hypothetical protein